MSEPSVFDTPFVPDPNQYYIPCQVMPGMFKGEWIVILQTVNPRAPHQSLQTEAWVDERSVKDLDGTPARRQPVNGKLRVSWDDTVDGLAVIILPQPSIPLGTKVFVPEQTVEVVPA